MFVSACRVLAAEEQSMLVFPPVLKRLWRKSDEKPLMSACVISEGAQSLGHV
jgi:hypothetical protein